MLDFKFIKAVCINCNSIFNIVVFLVYLRKLCTKRIGVKKAKAIWILTDSGRSGTEVPKKRYMGSREIVEEIEGILEGQLRYAKQWRLRNISKIFHSLT